MDIIIPPISMNLPSSFVRNVNSLTPGEQLSSFFLKNMLKEIIKNESNGLFSENGNSSFMSEIFMDRVIEDIAKTDAFGINKIFADQLRSKADLSIIPE